MYETMPKCGPYLRGLLRPWKLLTFAAGMAWLIYGAQNFGIPDWDVGISLIMGGLTYLLAPWSIRVAVVAILRRPRLWLLWGAAALGSAWLTIDGSYFAYHTLMGNSMFRLANLLASTCIYLVAGIVWLFDGSLRQLWENMRHVVARTRTR